MTQHNMYAIIEKKKHGKVLSGEEIKYFIDSLMNKSIADYQASALLMAIYFQGMTTKETADLTDAMLFSGKTIKLADPTIVDKHSTGGIGDKTSFILAPIAAACGVKVPMIAGRGLGFTGGTVDKIEAIPNFNVNLSLKDFEQRLITQGLVLMGQTDEIAPADKKIYSLRDVTATIDSLPLITASIMSKKLAEGANGIVMDIKVGSGAFMKNKAQARKLAKSILATATRFNKKSVVLLTDMNQPLGECVGNAIEIIESIETLKGKGPRDLTEVSLHLAAHMICLAGIEKSFKKAYKKAKDSIKNGSALEEFRKLIINQGGDASVIDDYSKLKLAKVKTHILSPKNGYIKSFKNAEIGFMSTELGGGRKVANDVIDTEVGFRFHKKIGDKVSEGEALVTIYHHQTQADKIHMIKEDFIQNVVKISKTQPKKTELIFDILKN